jgi:hypothetical protein
MSFVSDLNAALETPHPDDAADRVHHLVANVLHRLDPGAEIKRTHYFTHTIVPDLVLRWGPSESRRERHVHLRFNVSSPAFGQDLDLLGGESPLFLGMIDRGDLAHPQWATTTQAAPNGSLITQSQAIEEFDAQASQEARTRKATGTLVRVGRGVIDEPRAERLGKNYRGALEAMTEVAAATDVAREAVELALALLDDYLPEEGELEVERALQSEWIRSGGDPYDFPSSTPWNAELLDIPSLREVLLSLLDSPQPVPPETWQRNAGFIRVEELGRVLGRDLRGGRFDAMARALLPNWTAKWVWTERQATPALFETYEWLIENGIVGLEASDLKTFFADDGRHFKDKEGGNPLPMLSEARQLLSQPGLQEVGLLGPMEGIRYEPLSSAGEVFSRIQQILAGPGASSYRIHSVVAAVPSADAIANIDLSRQVIDLDGHSTPVATLARMATRFFSRASRPEGLDHFLATGEPPPPGWADRATA